MPFSYKIIYDIKKDMWNWRGGTKSSMFGQSNINNITNESDRKIANKIAKLNKQPAEIILKPYLAAKKANPNSQLNKFIPIAEKDFKDKFTDACLTLERLTKRPIVSSEFTFYVTTFPRMTVFFDRCVIYMYASTEPGFDMPIDGFMHEGLHFQFNHYWRQNPASPVSKLAEDEFIYLNEALTTILDEELMPLLSVPDTSYQIQAPFRNLLHAHWKKHHDFDKLIDYGLSTLALNHRREC